MNFETNELTSQVAQTAKDFAQQHIKPHLMEWDELQEFPLPVFKKPFSTMAGFSEDKSKAG